MSVRDGPSLVLERGWKGRGGGQCRRKIPAQPKLLKNKLCKGSHGAKNSIAQAQDSCPRKLPKPPQKNNGPSLAKYSGVSC